MGATYRKRGKRYLVTVHSRGQREYKTVRSIDDAKALVQQVHKQELAGVNVIEVIRKTRMASTALTREWPRLRDALPAFIKRMTEQGE